MQASGGLEEVDDLDLAYDLEKAQGLDLADLVAILINLGLEAHSELGRSFGWKLTVAISDCTPLRM